MRKLSHTGISITAFVLLIGITAIASEKDTRTVKLFYPAALGGNVLKPGEYNVKLESHSPEVTLTFVKDGKTVATTQGRWEDHNSVPTRNEVVYDTNQDGSQMVSEIRFRGTKEVIVLNDSSQAAHRSDHGQTGAH